MKRARSTAAPEVPCGPARSTAAPDPDLANTVRKLRSMRAALGPSALDRALGCLPSPLVGPVARAWARIGLGAASRNRFTRVPRNLDWSRAPLWRARLTAGVAVAGALVAVAWATGIGRGPGRGGEGAVLAAATPILVVEPHLLARELRHVAPTIQLAARQPLAPIESEPPASRLDARPLPALDPRPASLAGRDAVLTRGEPEVAPASVEPEIEPRPASARDALVPVATLPDAEPVGVQPSRVWLVESGTDWEQYSNGLRIETGFTVDGEKRAYRVFTEADGMDPQVRDQPVGILFHTTESRLWPLEAAYNDHLIDSSQGLLRFVQKERAYHYIVDRFGRVYRVVDEAAKANHAGNAIWENGGRIYLNLNHAFLGISFETRWEGGKALPITQAQLAAGRNLTAWLRQRWDIAPEMCVTHGLTSVNPRTFLIGHHLDWARGFPFAAFGLPDQYQRPAPSVILFGFDYDDHFLSVIGEPWSGVREAERALADEAARQGRPIESLRRERRALYSRWLREQADLGEPARAAALHATAGGS